MESEIYITITMTIKEIVELYQSINELEEDLPDELSEFSIILYQLFENNKEDINYMLG